LRHRRIRSRSRWRRTSRAIRSSGTATTRAGRTTRPGPGNSTDGEGNAMTLRNVFIALAVVAATAVPAFAEEPADDRMVGAWEDAIGDQEPILTDKQFAALNNLAFQAAVTKVCDGYQIDQ